MRMHRHLVFVVLAIAVFASGVVGGYVKKAQKGYARKAQGTKVKAKASEESSAGHLSKDQWINGISGFYEMDRNLQSNDQQNKWYTVKITWTEAKGAFKWQNRAGVTWTLTPLSGSSGSWDETKLAVGNDCPYKNEGHEFANIEWGSLEGSPVVTTIYGPWNEPYLRDLQGTEFEFETGTEAIASAIVNKPEPTCETKVRKIRGRRDIELENRRFAGEKEMAQKRLDRDAEIADITKQEREQLGKVRTEKTKELEGVLEQQEHCDVEEEEIEATCKTEWNKQIEEARAQHEEQKEKVREERDVELELTRQHMDAELAEVNSEDTDQYEAVQQAKEQQLETLREEREEECNAAGLEEACTDRFDDQIEGEQQAMEEELDSMRKERDEALEAIETDKTEKVKELEKAREGRLDALRKEWEKACTDQCTMCRETQEELMEAVHLEYEENISKERIHADEEVRATVKEWKDNMDQVKVEGKAEIERLHAKRDTTCAEEAANEEKTCREKYDEQLEEVRDERDAELEGTLAGKEKKLEDVRTKHEDQIAAIKEQKAKKLGQIETEEAVQLEHLRKSREGCDEEGDEHGETCREKHDKTLDKIRTERDKELDEVRKDAEEAQKQVEAKAKEELAIIQAQIEQELKNIREQRFEEIGKIMRKCEDVDEKGACLKLEEVCPAVREQRYDKITALCAEEE